VEIVGNVELVGHEDRKDMRHAGTFPINSEFRLTFAYFPTGNYNVILVWSQGFSYTKRNYYDKLSNSRSQGVV